MAVFNKTLIEVLVIKNFNFNTTYRARVVGGESWVFSNAG